MARVVVAWLNPLKAWLQDGFPLLPDVRHATFLSLKPALSFCCHFHLKCSQVRAPFPPDRCRISFLFGYSQYHLAFWNTCTTVKLFLFVGNVLENILASCTLQANRFYSYPSSSQDSMFQNCNLPGSGINRIQVDDAILKQIPISLFPLTLAEKLLCCLVLDMRCAGFIMSLASLESSKRTAFAPLGSTCLPLRLFFGLIRLLDRHAKELSSFFNWDSILALIAGLPFLAYTFNASCHDFQAKTISEAWVS
jgi:hypothetical protein